MGPVSGVMKRVSVWHRAASWESESPPQAFCTGPPKSLRISQAMGASAGPPRSTGSSPRRNSSFRSTCQNCTTGRLTGSLAPKNTPTLRTVGGRARGGS